MCTVRSLLSPVTGEADPQPEPEAGIREDNPSVRSKT